MKIIPGRYRYIQNGDYCSTYNIIGVAVHTETREQYVLFQKLDPFHGNLSHMPLAKFVDGLNSEYFCKQVGVTARIVSPLSASYELQPGLYQHEKGGRYNVLGASTGVDTEEKVAVYQPLSGEGRHGFLLRPLAMFRERVEKPERDYFGPRFFLLEHYADPHIATENQD